MRKFDIGVLEVRIIKGVKILLALELQKPRGKDYHEAVEPLTYWLLEHEVDDIYKIYKKNYKISKAYRDLNLKVKELENKIPDSIFLDIKEKQFEELNR